jgi:Mrp family chromosome partitioning ATPase
MQDMAFLTGEYPRSIPRAIWLAARARNAVRRPVVIGSIGVGTLIAAVLALVLAPQQIKHTGEPGLSEIGTRPDTVPLAAALVQSRTRLSTAQASLAQARVRVATVAAQPVDTVSPMLIRQRDSLSTVLNELDALLTRVETAPVAGSYRALAESPHLGGNTRVRSLADSLLDVERDRDAFGATGAADPMYVALTTRATEIGRSIQEIAQQRRDALRLQIAKLNMPAQRQTIAETPAVDTAGWVAERDSAQSLVAQASTSLSEARDKARDYDRAVQAARERANAAASPYAFLGAALVFGVALGFGIAFVDEMRRPRISADEHEVERVTGARVLATIAPRPKNPDRARRSADRAAPRYFDPGADGYQLAYLHVARTGASRLMLTIASADTGVAAVVAMNVAAIAADEARSTIVIDTDARTSPVAAALRSHAEPGVADILQRQMDWAEIATQAPVGRDRFVDVIPSGISGAVLDPLRVTELFRTESPRLLRHYEAVVLVASMDQAIAGLPGALPIPDTIVCARVGHTRISDVNVAIDRIRAAGGNPLGLVLWDALPPRLPSPEKIARSPRPVRTAEMEAMTTAG